MLILLNGEQREFPAGLTLTALVEHLGMKADRVAVELNLEIVPRTKWADTHLKEGDKLEVVHFVGGGSSSQHSAHGTPGSSTFSPRILWIRNASSPAWW